MHPLLARQLRRHGGSEASPPESWTAFVEAVSAAYEAADGDRNLLERALDLASDELLGANRRLEAEQARLHGAFEQVPAAVAVYRGPRHVFTFVNAAWRRLTGRDDSALGKPFAEVFPEIAGGPLMEVLDRVYASGEPYRGDEVHVPLDRAGDGTLEDTYWNFVWQPLGGLDGEEREVLLHATDVTAQVVARRAVEEQADQLRRLSNDLARSNDELDRFAYAASHDLRAPLRGIGAVAGWIEEDLGEERSAEVAEHLRLLRSRVERLDALVEGLLQYSRAGRVDLGVEPVELEALVDGVVDLLALDPEQSVEVGPLPVVVASPAALQQVFQNLVGNAFKYGATRVRCEAREHPDHWDITVADDGPGIPEEFHRRVFGLFQRLHARDDIEGAGIGLALVKKIVERHDASIDLESAPGRGATFHIRWPRADVVPEEEPSRRRA